MVYKTYQPLKYIRPGGEIIIKFGKINQIWWLKEGEIVAKLMGEKVKINTIKEVDINQNWAKIRGLGLQIYPKPQDELIIITD